MRVHLAGNGFGQELAQLYTRGQLVGQAETVAQARGDFTFEPAGYCCGRVWRNVPIKSDFRGNE